ncbi:MAG: hypothetical protein RBS36_10055 [Thiomicrospira sp.]|nr:hypothetical protein [Thiomicrospira sp.]
MPSLPFPVLVPGIEPGHIGKYGCGILRQIVASLTRPGKFWAKKKPVLTLA